MVELLSPVGNFDCLKSAVQNGANAVYFGADNFSARAFADNFNLSTLKEAITYAKLRGVKTNLALNTLITNKELKNAINLAKNAYKFGIDAIIVQDLGLANLLIKNFPDLDIHASTQMTVHNLEGVLELEKMGFKRVVLARELSINEIEYICANSNIEIECFVHGALCISYSGQCLFSSLVGGRSGNRGKCAQSCRLPYTLLENGKKIDNGYLLSTKDLCSLEFLPSLIQSGVKSFKIEGRMKSSEYVALTTRIYRKYIDLAQYCIKNNCMENYIIDEQDKKDLMQIFNRGNFSNGHLDNKANKDLIYKEKPNNMGLFLGVVEKYNILKGHITVKLNDKIEIGDTIALQNETCTYTISELLKNGQNITETHIGDTVTIGRMKGTIRLGDKIYKISSKKLNTDLKNSFSKEHKKIMLNASVKINENKPISMTITIASNHPKIYNNLNITCTIPEYIPTKAINHPINSENVILQITKTNNTPYEFKNIQIDLDDNVFLPKVSMINKLRRQALSNVQDFATNNIIRKNIPDISVPKIINNNVKPKQKEISVLLNKLNLDYSYDDLDNGINNIYIPLKYFTLNEYKNIIVTLSKKYNLYIYMPVIVKSNYRNLFISNIEQTLEKLPIKGFVISNIGNLKLLQNLNIDINKFQIIANYSFNIYNISSIYKLKELNINRYTISPELDKENILDLCNNNLLDNELIIYGKLPLMNIRYCLLGKSNLCYPECDSKCRTKNYYELKDRLQMKFRFLPDNVQTVTTIFNSKTLSIEPKNFNVNCIRIDILDENIKEINKVIFFTKKR